MAEITENGFIGKTQNEYFDEERQLYLDIDPDFNLDPSTPDGLKIAHDAEVFTNLDEAARLAYNSKDPNKARKVELNIVSSITGTFRNDGTPSNAGISVTGVTGTIILAGSLIESSIDGTQWAVDADITIAAGVGNGTVTALINGSTQADAATLSVIVTSTGGWQTVTNLAVATPGTDQETDPQLRLRRALSVGRPGDNQVDSMLGEIGATAGVRRFKIYENDTNITDGNGLPAHSIAPVVDGGSDTDVALSIYLKKNPGVFLHPAATLTSVDVPSPKYPANIKTIKFSRPDFIDIVLAVTVVDDGSLPANAADLIEQAILDYTQGDLIAADVGFNVLGFDIGEDVPISRMYTPVNNIIGQYGNSYISALTLNGGGANIAVAFNELSRWTEANITVTIT